MTDTKDNSLDNSLKNIIEAALFAANRPLAIDQLLSLFPENEQPERSHIREILRQLQQDYLQHGIELIQVASGYRFQVKQELAPWIKRLWSERSPRYSRALLETIAIIAYRQPVTRSEIETIRGISVNPDILKKLLEYNWIRVLAHRDSPGRPALYGTTRHFLDHFNLKTLNDLPPLAEIKTLLPYQEEMFAHESVEEKNKPDQENAQPSEKVELEVEQFPEQEKQNQENVQPSEKVELEVEQLPEQEKQNPQPSEKLGTEVEQLAEESKQNQENVQPSEKVGLEVEQFSKQEKQNQENVQPDEKVESPANYLPKSEDSLTKQAMK